jgi:hypothetical protein
MIQTNDLVSTLPEPLLPAVQQLLDLQALIDANVPNDAKWIYTENPSEWPKYFSSGEDKQWSLQDPVHTTSNTGFCAKIESKRELLRCDSEICNNSNFCIFL